jgi:HPt (histidine-containing phosphotransfer) domain-containing protein
VLPEPVDVSSLVMLRQLQRPDGPDRVGMIVTRFLEECRERSVTLQQAVDDSDAAALEASAHALKGIAGTVGANELRDIAWQLEQLGRAGTTLGAQPHLDELDAAWRRAAPIFEDLRGSVNAEPS